MSLLSLSRHVLALYTTLLERAKCYLDDDVDFLLGVFTDGIERERGREGGSARAGCTIGFTPSFCGNNDNW